MSKSWPRAVKQEMGEMNEKVIAKDNDSSNAADECQSHSLGQ